MRTKDKMVQNRDTYSKSSRIVLKTINPRRTSQKVGTQNKETRIKATEPGIRNRDKQKGVQIMESKTSHPKTESKPRNPKQPIPNQQSCDRKAKPGDLNENPKSGTSDKEWTPKNQENQCSL